MIDTLPVRSIGATAMVPWSEELAALLTREDRYGERFLLYSHTPGQEFAEIPRGLAGKTISHDFRTTRPTSQLIAKAKARNPDQAACVEKSTALLLQGVDHICEAPTGFGKTFVGAAVALNLRQTTLIVVTKNDLVKAWRDTLINLMGVPPGEIGHAQQNTLIYKDCRFVIAMIHSLVCREYTTDFYQHFGLVIFDEIHRLGADYFIEACKLFPARSRLGLSATPKRGDGREALFHAHIGPVLVKGTWVPMSPKILIKETGWKVPMVNRKTDTGWTRAAMDVTPGRMMGVNKAIASDVMRNKEIAKFVREAYDVDRRTLVVSDLIDDHLRPLFHYLVEVGIPTADIGFYIGGMKEVDLTRSKKMRVILATYQMISEGTDIAELDTLVMATPRSNVKQVIGRVMRFLEGKKQPVVLDLVDNHSVLRAFHFTRLKQYYSVGSEIVKV